MKGWLFVVIMQVVCGHFLVVCGSLPVIWGHLWSLGGSLWSFAGSLWFFAGSLWSFMLTCGGLRSLPILVTRINGLGLNVLVFCA